LQVACRHGERREAVMSVSFPGIDQVVSATYTLAHGITPGLAFLEIAPQGGFVGEGGALVFEFGGVTLVFPDCKIDTLSLARTSQGLVWRLAILDRRWKWAFPTISGVYNVRAASGEILRPDASASPGASIVLDTERTPQELAALLLDALGETLYSVAELPNDTRPRVDWDHTPAASALAELCEALGCRVVLALDGTVAIRRLGAGAALPELASTIDRWLGVDPPERPDALAVVCGPTRHQVDLLLEAVGRDLDGSIKPIDDLSYKPAGGWGDIDLAAYLNLADPRAAELAAATVFRWYRIKTPFDVPTLDAAQGIRIETAHTLFEIALGGGEQVETELFDGYARGKPSQVWGVWYDRKLSFVNTVAKLATITDFQSDYALAALVSRGWRIDAERGMVVFAEPVYRLETVAGELKIAPAELVLRTSIRLRDSQRAWSRYARMRPLGATWGTQAKAVFRDDVFVNVVARYNPAGYPGLVGVDTNQADVDAEADSALDAAEAALATRVPEARWYAGLVPISPDGAIVHVSWSMGPAGTTTIAGRNQEPWRRGPTYRERRFFERLASRGEAWRRRLGEDPARGGGWS
jgi:hypothetical protein